MSPQPCSCGCTGDPTITAFADKAASAPVKCTPCGESASSALLSDEDTSYTFAVKEQNDRNIFFLEDFAPRPIDEFAFYCTAKRNISYASSKGGGDRVKQVRRRAFAHSDLGGPYDEYIAVMDSGATNHTFRDRGEVTIFNRRPANIRMISANGSQTHVTERGDIYLDAEDGKGTPLPPLILKDVSLLKGSPLNLISVSMLCEAGSKFHFEKNNSYFIFHGRKFKLIEKDGLYLLKLNEILHPDDLEALRRCAPGDKQCYKTVFSESGINYALAADWKLWHERFAHASAPRIEFLVDNGSVEGLHV
jgi:hypothetical protein